MNQYVGCGHARTLLEGLVDGELSMADQLAVESHLRWCETCAVRVEDFRVIGAWLRTQSCARPLVDEPEADATLRALSEGLAVRVRAERAQALPSRLREMFSDMHLLWPALGATVAVMVCVAAAVSVLRASTTLSPNSLAGLISALGSPGTEKNPLRPADNGISIPRLLEEEAARAIGTLERMPDDDVIYTVRTVVGRDGSVSTFVLLSDDNVSPGRTPAAREVDQQAVLNAVRNTRFVPAQTPLGHAVAVDVVWVIAKTTAVAGPPVALRGGPSESRAKGPKVAPLQPSSPPVSGVTPAVRASTTA